MYLDNLVSYIKIFIQYSIVPTNDKEIFLPLNWLNVNLRLKSMAAMYWRSNLNNVGLCTSTAA